MKYVLPESLSVKRETKAVLALLFLSPAFGELVSGSSPPLEFFFPTSFLGLVALYGCGALLIRELVIRQGKGWPSLVLYGAAYGVYEEGLTVKSWFDPGWMDLGRLGTYGRFAEVNWVWAAWLTVYHTTISIVLPIFLVDVLFPDLKGRRLLSDRALKWPAIAFAVVGLLFFIAFPYRPGPEYVVAIVAAVAFAVLGREAPARWLAAPAARAPRAAWPLGVLGAVWLVAVFTIFNSGVDFGWHPALTVAVGLAAAAAGPLALRGCLPPVGGEKYLFAFLGGTLSLLILFGLVLGTFSPAGYLGMNIVAVVTAAWLYRVYRKSVPRWEAGAPSASVPVAGAASSAQVPIA